MDKLAKQQACQLAIEQEIEEGLAQGKSKSAIPATFWWVVLIGFAIIAVEIWIVARLGRIKGGKR